MTKKIGGKRSFKIKINDCLLKHIKEKNMEIDPKNAEQLTQYLIDFKERIKTNTTLESDIKNIGKVFIHGAEINNGQGVITNFIVKNNFSFFTINEQKAQLF